MTGLVSSWNTKQTLYSYAFGICYNQNGGVFTSTFPCNYRNISLNFVEGTAAAAVYNVTFYQLAANAGYLGMQVNALLAALPSTPGTVGGIAYGMSAVQGGNIAGITSVTAGLGPFTPPPPPAYACHCTHGYSGQDCSVSPDQLPPPVPSPPTPALSPPPLGPAPIGSWALTDSGEVIAINMLFDDFAPRQAALRRVVAKVLAEALNTVTGAIVVVSFQKSTVGTTLIYFDILLGATSSSEITSSFFAVQSLFGCSGDVVPGSAACPALQLAFQNNGFPVDVYYNDQLTGGVLDPMRISTDPGQLASWLTYQSEVVSLNLSISSFAPFEERYSAAFCGAIAHALNISSDRIDVTDFQGGSGGKTLIYFYILMDYVSSTSTAAIETLNTDVSNLFACSSPGCPAQAALTSALALFGLPVQSFYLD